MFKRSMAAAVVAAILWGVWGGSSAAADIVDLRSRAMKGLERALRDISAGLSGVIAFDPVDVQAKAEGIRAEVAAIPTRFPEGSLSDTSEALPAIWERKAEFADAAQNALRHADALAAAAKAGDQERILKSLRKLNQACSNCHATFRRK